MLLFWGLTATNHNTANDLSFMIPALSSALLWPVVFFVLRSWRRGFQVS